MVMPNGWRNSEPTPVPSISGSAASRADSVVIKMGLKRSRQASKIASRGDLPCSRSAASAKSIIIMAFFLTMPISRMMPMMPMMPRSLPDTCRASNAPTPADGSVDRMVIGWI